jgi:hypothetical protein
VSLEFERDSHVLPELRHIFATIRAKTGKWVHGREKRLEPLCERISGVAAI